MGWSQLCKFSHNSERLWQGGGDTSSNFLAPLKGFLLEIIGSKPNYTGHFCLVVMKFWTDFQFCSEKLDAICMWLWHTNYIPMMATRSVLDSTFCAFYCTNVGFAAICKWGINHRRGIGEEKAWVLVSDSSQFVCVAIITNFRDRSVTIEDVCHLFCETHSKLQCNNTENNDKKLSFHKYLPDCLEPAGCGACAFSYSRVCPPTKFWHKYLFIFPQIFAPPLTNIFGDFWHKFAPSTLKYSKYQKWLCRAFIF